jgi:predicted RNase H-like HicB family nuclease
MQIHERPVVEHYRFSVEWSAEDDEFVATVAEFPSLSWLEPSQGKALEGLQGLLREVIDDMLTRGEDVPIPFPGAASAAI